MSETNGAANNGNPETPWFGDAHKDLVTAKGWKGPDDALTSYSQLETHLGAPPDRLIRLPEASKIDDAFRADVFKRIGYSAPAAPEKWEDYGIQATDGSPPEYAAHMGKLAHSLGITKAQMDGLVKGQNEFAAGFSKTALDAETKQISDRIAAADAAQATRFGANLPKMQEGMLREALRLGIKAEDMPELEKDLAASDRLGIFRTMLGDLAQLRAEGALHNDGDRGTVMSADQAKAALDAKKKDSDWVTKALTRGTPEAEENIRLNALAQGITLSPEEITRQAKGLGASV